VKFLRTYEFRNLVLSLPAFILWTNLGGASISILVFTFLQFGLPIVQRFERNHPEEISRENVCEFIEIFLLGTNAGLTKLETLNLVLETASEPLRSEISRVISRCKMGIGLATSLSYTAERYPIITPVLAAISRSEITGAPVSAALEIDLMLNRAQAANEILQRVRSLSVKCVLPLGICFLPAFVLVTIVPIVATLLPSIFSKV
jgi:pilus assembly protein TadC